MEESSFSIEESLKNLHFLLENLRFVNVKLTPRSRCSGARDPQHTRRSCSAAPSVRIPQ